MVAALYVSDVPLQQVHRLLVSEAEIRGYCKSVSGQVVVEEGDSVEVSADSRGVGSVVGGGGVWEIAEEDVVASTEGGDVGDHFVSGGEPGPSSDVVLHDCVYSIKWVDGERHGVCTVEPLYKDTLN